VIPVTVIVAEPGGISRIVMSPGWLESADEAILSVSLPGRISGVNVSEGEMVEAGDILVTTVTDRVHDSGLLSASARVSAAAANEAYTRENLQRKSDLLQSGSASSWEYEMALIDFRTASATLASARAAYAQARDGVSRGVLSAPFPGRVTRVWAREGNPAAGPLVAISGGGILKCGVLLPSRALPWLSPGLPAFFTTPHHPGALFQGTVSSASSSVDPITGLVQATVQLGDSSGLLLPGMSGMVSIALETAPEAISLPRNAFVHSPDGSLRVMVIDGGRAVGRTVETGFESGYRTALLSGIDSGDSVIVLGNRIVSDGDRVRVVEP